MTNHQSWDSVTWEGSRRAQIRRSLNLSVRQRLEALEELTETSERLAGLADQPAAWSQRAEAGLGGRHSLLLAGCSPTPLASYLKALGVLRLVAEQVDAEARGHWVNEVFVLSTTLSEDDVIAFFSDLYVPTPILAPWNGGSGFYPKDNKSGIEPLEASSAERFAEFRTTIAQLRQILAREGIASSPNGDLKRHLLVRLRAEAEEALLDWLDAVVLLTEENPKYPPLLGTGGNDGRLDFTNNFMQRLIEVIAPETGELRPKGMAYLKLALLGTAAPDLPNKAIGQFMPGAAGGPNADNGFEAHSLINPWDFILMLEGALLFAATATKRHTQLGEGQLSYPFTVRPTGSGSGMTAIADESPARAEVWMPLWEQPLGLPELRALLGEGRATVGRRAARDGLDFVRAVAKLGVERGITAFQRYSFMQRSGRAYLATPLNRVPVRRNPRAELIDQLERNQFLDRFRRFTRGDHASNHAQQLAHVLEDALFELAHHGDPEKPQLAQAITEALGDIVLYLANSPAARTACPRLPRLDAQWMLAGDDGTPEFRIAAALAGIGADDLPMLCHLLPVDSANPTRYHEESRLVTWHHGRLADNLAGLARRRLVETPKRDELPSKPFAGRPSADLGSIAAFLSGETDDERTARLLCGLSMIRQMPRYLPGGGPQPPLPAAYRVLKPLFATDTQLRQIGTLSEHDTLPLPNKVPALLAADRTQDAVDAALHRLRASGLPPAFRHLEAGRCDGTRLLAALMVPLDDQALSRLMHRIRAPQREEDQEHAVA